MPTRNTLARYREKRDFTRTPEPAGIAAPTEGHRYLIQKHAARRLHYDFRLELDGVLKSWAVTRGPSLDPHEKRLAVEVEDHPVSYGSFEGIIPQGEYGGGTVLLWDEGTWTPIGDPHEGLKKGKLEFALHGQRLQGEWTLVRMRGRDKDKGRHNWLLIKRTDDQARPGDGDQLLDTNMTSVASGRTMEQIAADEDRVWTSSQDPPAKAVSRRDSSAKSAKSRRHAPAKSALPGFIPPQLATLADKVPEGADWIHEVKFDGYRALAYLENQTVRILTRTGLDWTHRFASLVGLLDKLPVTNALLDGEIVALNADRVSSFHTLQESLSEGRGAALQYYVFDLLFLNGVDLRPLPLIERKDQLQTLLQKQEPGSRIFYSEHFPPPGDAFLKRLCGMHMEGVVSKRRDAPYTSGRSASWLKAKCHQRQEFVIGGFTLPTHGERGIGALLIGYYDASQLIYAGKVGTGFDQDSGLRVRGQLDPLVQKSRPFAAAPPATVARKATWVKPALVCEVEFSEWTPDGRLRHPSFKGLREDKPAEAVTRDIPVKAERTHPTTSEEREVAAEKKTTARTRKTTAADPKTARVTPAHSRVSSSDPMVANVRISHPDRIVFPGTAITKLRLAEYYHTVADAILPHIVDRPLSMLRCPDGIGKTCFFQRHVARGQSPDIHEIAVEVKGHQRTGYLAIDSIRGLIALVQWGVIEFHPWGCRTDRPDLPDRLIFDLDPDPAAPHETLLDAAREIQTRMTEFELVSFLKTTGGKGLHVVVPLTRSLGWGPVKAFARAVAESLAHDSPTRYIATASKQARAGKVFIDYLRNDLTATSVAAYSVRARPGAGVSFPLDWKKLTPALQPADFTLETVPGLLAKRKADPWDDFFSTKQKISTRLLHSLKIDV